MPSVNIYIVLAIGISFILVGILFSQNVRVSRKRRKRRLPKMEKGENKDWQAVSLKLEKHIYALRKELVDFERREKNLEKELMIEKQKYAKSQEKLSQERGWKKKESSDIEKQGEVILRLKKDLTQVEHNLAREHGLRLRFERELKDLKDQIDSTIDEKRALEMEILKMKSQADVQRKEMLELREMNMKLSKKKEETAWVAKSEYQKLEEKLQETQKELEKLKSDG